MDVDAAKQYQEDQKCQRSASILCLLISFFVRRDPEAMAQGEPGACTPRLWNYNEKVTFLFQEVPL